MTMSNRQLPELRDEDSAPRLHRILDIADRIAEHRHNIETLKLELIDATRALSEVTDRNDRLRIARFCEENRKELGIRQNDLAFAFFGDENAMRKFRQLLADPYASCTRCGVNTLVGSQFESREILCDACQAKRHADMLASMAEREKRCEQDHTEMRAARARIRALRALPLLTQKQAEELSDLLLDEHEHMDWVQRVAHGLRRAGVSARFA